MTSHAGEREMGGKELHKHRQKAFTAGYSNSNVHKSVVQWHLQTTIATGTNTLTDD